MHRSHAWGISECLDESSSTPVDGSAHNIYMPQPRLNYQNYRLNKHSLRKYADISYNWTERGSIKSQTSSPMKRQTQTKESTPGQTAAQFKSE